MPAGLPDAIPRTGLPAVAQLAIENLLEDLALTRAEQLALLGTGIVIAAPHPGDFPGIEVLLVHGPMLYPGRRAVKELG